MPKVGNKHFSYTPQGRAEAARYAKANKKKVTNKTPKRKKR